MSKTLVRSLFQQSSSLRKLGEAISNREKSIEVSGLVGSSVSLVLAETFKTSELPFLVILNDKEEAAYHLNDLENLLGDQNVLFYPGSYRRPYQIEETDNANVLLRSEVLNRINSRRKPALIVTYPEALFEKVVTRKELERNTLKIGLNDELSIDFVNEVLFEYKFKRTDFVTEPGEFSVRGGILDVFSFSNDEPYRIEFFGDEVDSIRTFDVETQLSLDQLKKLSRCSSILLFSTLGIMEIFLKYIASKTVVVLKNEELLSASIEKLFQKAAAAFEEQDGEVKMSQPEELFCTADLLKRQLSEFTTVTLHNNTLSSNHCNITFNTKPQPSFNKQFNLLIENLNTNTADGYTNYIFCSSEQQAQRFHDIFDDISNGQDTIGEGHSVGQYETIVFPLYQGFIDYEGRNVCYTDHQIFERYHKFQLKNGYAKKQAITLKELTHLEVGDYVTHIDHGIGKFGGLQKIDVEGKTQEAIKLIYGERDILYLSIHSLHKISKYNGKDGTTPKIYKLGSAAWKKLKQKTKKRVKEIAFNLIELYAKRRLQKGFAYDPDSYLQHELESSFIYEDTPDQSAATADVKADMENERPMDRLVCGDVGFGKTEVAVRAAFKAVDNGKQVAIL
ncbi:MAG: CarD family transcriptional regulator, partial [Bacteroidota bacterium]